MRLANKVILITGSATGIGKAIAVACVAEGARVVIHGLESLLATDVVNQVGSDRAVSHVEDLTQEGCPQRLIDLAIATFGKLDAVVNNAAVVSTGTIHTIDSASFARTIAVNTLSPLLLIKAALPHLRQAKGTVLNIGSVNAYCGEPNLLGYSMSKGALMTLTRNLGDTLFREDSVRVNQINPGWVLTDNERARKKSHGLPDDWPASLPATIAPSGRILFPEEIAVAAIYWISDESAAMSGQVVDLEQYPLIGRNPPKAIR